ncbi:hypothetical protein E4634_13380 [Mangrovimicrobium sediminis]|uniref:Uncharacterized protein n=1 Tax=Mangrovimicrobium sediminis TaxID=2562682 RepID=A0A4Z0LZH4_9GAMM|nr:hypothetical protein [Haliea sp. SAOS-164]TGD72518.1 hypothetical protein E4634_13380 [Haliea sp. SAOS-164]
MNELNRFFSTRKGWIFSLSAAVDRGSDWGVPDLFFLDIENDSKREGDCFVFKTQVRGTVLNKDCHIQSGDGIAFYHSKRAQFPPGDEHGKRQRISLMGIVDECDQRGVDVSHLKVRIPEDVYEVIHEEPIVWTPERDEAFVSCGLRDGPVRAFYPVPSPTWSTFLHDVADRVEEYTGERPEY